MADDDGGKMPDLLGLGKLTRPIEKLIECVESGAGSWFEPHRIRRRAAAEADADRIRAQARVDIAEIEYRAQLRFEDREIRRQRNIEAIVRHAARELPETASDQPVDPDWAAFFFASCQDIGNDTMQALWARLLAGEVASPGTYSLRTLSTVRILGRAEAMLFTTFASFCWHFPNDCTAVFSWPDMYSLMEREGVSVIGVSELCALGLVGDQVELRIPRDLRAVDLHYGERHYTLRRPHSEQWGSPKIRPLGYVGKELFPICGARHIEGLVEQVRSVLWGAGRYVLGPRQLEGSNEARQAEYFAEMHGWIPVPCGNCNGNGRHSYKDERGTTITTADPCRECHGVSRFWIPATEGSGEAALLDSGIVARFAGRT